MQVEDLVQTVYHSKGYKLVITKKVLRYVEYRAVSGVFQNTKILPPRRPPLYPASASYPPTTKAGGGGIHSPGGEGGGGSIFWKTPDIGLASYIIISLRL